MTDLHYKKNGTLDMRYKSSKQYVESGGSVYGPLVDNDSLNYKSDGTLDMRFKTSKQYVESSGNINGPDFQSIQNSNTSNYRKRKSDQSFEHSFQKTNNYNYGNNYNDNYKNSNYDYNNNNYDYNNNNYNYNNNNYDYNNNNYNPFSDMNFQPQPDPFASIQPYDMNSSTFTDRNYQISHQKYDDDDCNNSKSNKVNKKKQQADFDVDDLYPKINVVERVYKKKETSKPESQTQISNKSNLAKTKTDSNYSSSNTNYQNMHTLDFKEKFSMIPKDKRKRKESNLEHSEAQNKNNNMKKQTDLNINISHSYPQHRKINSAKSIEILVIIELLFAFFYFVLLSFIPLPIEKEFFSKCPKNALCEITQKSNKKIYKINKCIGNYVKIESGLIQLCSPNDQPKLDEYIRTLEAASFISKNDGKLFFKHKNIDSQKIIELFPKSNPSLFETEDDFMVTITDNELKSRAPEYSAICRIFNNSVINMPVQTLLVIVLSFVLLFYYLSSRNIK